MTLVKISLNFESLLDLQLGIVVCTLNYLGIKEACGEAQMRFRQAFFTPSRL